MAKLPLPAFLAKWAGLAGRFADQELGRIEPKHFREFSQDTADSFGPQGPNNRPDLFKYVGWLNNDQDGYVSGQATIEDLDPALMCLATAIQVGNSDLGKNIIYRLKEAADGIWLVWPDASFSGTKVRVKIVAMGSADDVPGGIKEFNPYGPGPGADAAYAGPDVNGHNGAQVTYTNRLWETLQELKPSTFGGLIPAPGTADGRLCWKEISPTPVTHQQNTDRGTTGADFVIGLNSQSQGTTEYKLMGFLADAQRANVMLAARWVPQPDDSDLVELVYCLDYIAPPTRVGNVWKKVGEGSGGGAGVDGLYLEDDTVLNIDSGSETFAVDLGAVFPKKQRVVDLEASVEGIDQRLSVIEDNIINVADVDAAKRLDVASANQPRVGEADVAYRDMWFYDSTTLSPKIYYFHCAPVVEANGQTYYYWFRREIL